MPKKVKIKPKKALLIKRNEKTNYPEQIIMQSDERMVLNVPESIYTKEGHNPDLDLNLIETDQISTLNEYILYIGDLVGEANNNMSTPSDLIENLSDIFRKCIDKRELLEKEVSD